MLIMDTESGFISLDCGRPNDYTDKFNGLRYKPDNDFIDTGLSRMIAPEHQSNLLFEQFLYVRSFPEGTRNCYTLHLPQANSKPFLIRGRFMYGNYDNKHSLPRFDLHIGVDRWRTMIIVNESVPVRSEIIYTPKSDFIQVCLINTNSGIPFISALEIRPLDSNIYKTDYSLNYYGRWDLSSSSVDYYRYKDDIFDRIWLSGDFVNSTSLATTLTVAPGKYQLPDVVMKTANIPQNPNDSLVMSWIPFNLTDQFYIVLHFAELTPNATREFNIYVNKELLFGLYSPKYLVSETGVAEIDVSSIYSLSLTRTNKYMLPPLLNAMELYTIMKQVFHSQTDDRDVGGLMGIKSTYKVKKNNWQGDPCGPEPFSWDGIKCMNEGFNPPRIISLNLSSSGLTGEISPFIKNLTSLQTLDLSNNSLSGDVSDFLSQFRTLKYLNLSGNHFTCPMPQSLQGKISDYCNANNANNSKNPGRNYTVVAVAASVAGFFFLLIVASIIIYCCICIKRDKKQTIPVQSSDGIPQGHKIGNLNFELKNCQFSYSEICKITNNFQTVLGNGGFGTVYHGHIGNNPVAVKMLSESSTQGYKEFQAEAKFLVSINHKNLISIIGYCYEDDKMGLVYEFMENGNLENYVSERSSLTLNWEERLRIAVDAAQGLEYLHNGCKPSIIHRDVKSSNILVNGKFEAKLADFGLSRTIPTEGKNYVSTVVAGTPGYLDPEYFVTNRLTGKTDVYAFGIVLLEIVTGKLALGRSQGSVHIVQWVGRVMSTADATQIVDRRLEGDFDTNCLWKFVELAMVCVSRESEKRPNMSEVVMRLKECLASEMARHDTRSTDSMGQGHHGFMSVGLMSEALMAPLAR